MFFLWGLLLSSALVFGCAGLVWLLFLPRRARKSGPILLSGDGTFSTNAVGESHYVAAFEAIRGPREENWVERQAAVVLVREPFNPYDANAVALYIGGHKVGHLSRGDAAVWAPYLDHVAAGGAPVMCKGRIRGGWDDGEGNVGHFGLTLDLPPAPR